MSRNSIKLHTPAGKRWLEKATAEAAAPKAPAAAPAAKAKAGKPAPSGAGEVRIIGGQWRRTRLPVAQRPGLRPTPDRVRETLFNWLMPRLGGARVLDLFAGSGALGLEAVSRGAAHATLVERDAQLGRNLTAAVTKLQASDQISVVQADALRWLQGAPAQQADLVFVDPPFADGLWQDVLAQLPRHLAADAWLYLESPAGHVPVLPPDWLLHREGGTREVRFALYRRATATL